MVSRILENEIESCSCPVCSLCNSPGELIYSQQTDRLYGVPGYWGFKECTNPICGLIWLDPMPLENELYKTYRNYYTHQDITGGATILHRVYHSLSEGYLALFHGFDKGDCPTWKKIAGVLLIFFPGLRSEQSLSVMDLNNNEKGKLLEIGCGNGNMLRFFHEMGWDVEGVDFDPEAVKTARKKDIEVYPGTIEEQNYSDNTFDIIVMNHLIEHIKNPISFLQECHRILRPGGQLVVITPNSHSFGHKKFKSAWRGLEPPRHLNIFSPYSMYNLLQRTGFKEIKLKTEVRIANYIFSVSKMLEQNTTDIDQSTNHLIIKKIWARMFRFTEWLALFYNPEFGEEIVVKAKKQGL
jgi:2-polyprenyl-3-methyl-5-hydroxy-6-metoxy-1,4-benzoquinol methylase